METSKPRAHIESIRKNKYWIGEESSLPVGKDLRMAVKYLSAELYSKDVHFLMELIQNAEDNEYEEGVEPTLEFLLTYQDVTKTGATATLIVFNNEKGFSPRNVDSICAVGDSTKVGQRKKGYIGEKGIGFKSVFLLTSQPYIFSNGYQIRFSDKPCPQCDIAYIVPEWVDENPTLSDLERIYGGSIPTTAIILPLKPDKLQSVEKQLAAIHPELLLFLSKIRRLTVKEDGGGSGQSGGLKPIQSISISSEKDYVQRNSIDAESFTLHLAVDEDDPGKDSGETECSYYMWRQRFPVKDESRVESRMEVDEWTITLAFPCGTRLSRGMVCAGIYAFLPTEMFTDFPFIIQADFILQSSREAILMDSKWNLGILDCVPDAFMNSFTSLVKKIEGAPASSLANMFSFMPIKESTYQRLNAVRDSIKNKIQLENIIPSEDLQLNQRFFHRPCEVGRLAPSFWNILFKAENQGLKLHNLSSHGKYVLNSSLDKKKYDDALNFLSIEYVDNDWYSKCIRSSDLVLGVDEETYADLLNFVAVNWSVLQNTGMLKLPLLKYIGRDGLLSLYSIDEVKAFGGPILCRSQYISDASWLIGSSRELRCAANLFFFPKETQEALSRKDLLVNWLSDELAMKTLTVYQYAQLIHKSLSCDCNLPLAFAHFVYRSFSKRDLSQSETERMCHLMPLVDSYGNIITNRNGVLVPANGSRWIQLLGSNPWRSKGYVELNEKYMASRSFCGEFTPGMAIVDLFKNNGIASDIPDLSPPNSALPSVYAPLTKDNAFLLLDWIRKLKSNGQPSNFLKSLKEGSWCRVLISGSSLYRPPSLSFISGSSWNGLLEECCIMVDIPVIDQRYYGHEIASYEEELKMIGVRSGCEDVCVYIGEHLMSVASNSGFTRSHLIAILTLIRYLRDKYLSPDKLITNVRNGRLKTSCGDRSADGSVLYDEGWKSARLVSDTPFIDEQYYGDDIVQYKTELQLLGVVIGVNEICRFVVHYLKPHSCLNSLNPEALVLLLKCIRFSASPRKVVDALKSAKCLRTTKGYMSPYECFLPDPEWGCILDIFDCFPIIDCLFYGDCIFSYKVELGLLGVKIDIEDASKEFFKVFKQKVESSALNRAHVLSFLACFRKLKGLDRGSAARDIFQQVMRVKWLKTRLGDNRSPAGCILFSSEWETISGITKLPFIDDSDAVYGLSIHEYKDELKSMGVIIDIKKNEKFVLDHVCFPGEVAPADVICLLECIRNVLLVDGTYSFPKSFIKEISKKWLKTKFGYRCPKGSILFGSKWQSFLQFSDGPFIDGEYYGPSISSYYKELNAIGVVVEVADGTHLLARYLGFLCDSDSIKRIYGYLNNYNWKPKDEASKLKLVWVPDSAEANGDGSWVEASKCVLHDGDGMFRSKLIVLKEKGYDDKLLSFFARAFKVRSHPSIDDYCQLWKHWESSEHKPSHAECCSFWAYIVNHWNLKNESALLNDITRVPSLSHSDEIILINKSSAFIPDDLLLKDLFSSSSSAPLFVWTPQPSHPSIPRSRLLEIYKSMGVKTISESAVREESSLLKGENNLRPAQLGDVYLRRGLFMLVLGFLSADSLGMEPNLRHKIVKRLLQVAAYETTEPITVSYSLPVSSSTSSLSRPAVAVEASRMIRWEKEKSEFLAQKPDGSKGQRGMVEYATNLAQVVSQGLLWEKEELIPKLEELIKFGFVMDFNEDAVVYYLKTKNLEVFKEDEEYLSSVFPSSTAT